MKKPLGVCESFFGNKGLDYCHHNNFICLATSELKS